MTLKLETEKTSHPSIVAKSGADVSMVSLIILAGMSVAVYAPLFPWLMETWLNDSNHSHGLLVPLISLYLVWELKDQLHGAEVTSSKVGLVLLITSLLIYIASYAGGLAFPARLTIVTTIAGVVLFNFGWKIFSLVLFPILFLFFMIPIPDTILGLISFPLQLFVTDASSHIIDWYGIPVYKDGNLLHFPLYSFEVTEGCSGIRSMYTFLCIAAFFAYMEKNNILNSIILILSAIPLAIFVNIIRVSGTGLLANSFGPKVAQGFLHDFSGFVVFGFGIALMIGEIWLLKKMRKPQTARPVSL